MMIYNLPPTPVIECVGCTPNEIVTLDFLQQRGIEDLNALAVVMGNIQQESRFTPNICEGGAIVPYDQCLHGGYGLIQWTSTNRYLGLGSFAHKYGGNPSTITTQLHYMVNERQWQDFNLYLQIPGHSVEHYMTHAYKWLGWGIHGNRTKYAYSFLNKFNVVIPHADEESVPDKVLPSTHSQAQREFRFPFGFSEAST